MIPEPEYLKQEQFEIERLREKIDAICARNKCEHLAEVFENICRNKALMFMYLCPDESDRGEDLKKMAMGSLALTIRLIEELANQRVAQAFAECFNEASSFIDEAMERAQK